jgi:hypothetical protein
MPFAPPNLLISLESLGSNPTLSAVRDLDSPVRRDASESNEANTDAAQAYSWI